MDCFVLLCNSWREPTSVPCKLNNVRQTITPWTILKMELFEIIRVRINKTANENSWVIFARQIYSKHWFELSYESLDTIFWEFDPGSGRTLAACLTHASRTGLSRACFWKFSGERVSNAWETCLSVGDNSWKRLLIPHNTLVPHGTEVKA